jgi:hypothetical protein
MRGSSLPGWRSPTCHGARTPDTTRLEACSVIVVTLDVQIVSRWAAIAMR